MRRTRRVSCLLAAAVLLTACSGTAGDGPGAPSVTVPIGPEPTATAESPPPAAPGTGSSGGAEPEGTSGVEADGRDLPGRMPDPGAASERQPAYTSARLEAAVTAADRSLALGGEVLSEETLRAILPDTGSLGPEVTFEPAACAQIAAADSVAAVQDASLAGLAYGPETEAASVLNVAAYSGDSVLDTLDFIDEAVLADCAEVRMSRDGSTVTVTNTRLDVSTAAEETLALDTVVSSPSGQTRLVVVSARTGSVRLVVSVPAPPDARQAAGEAGLLIDAVLAELDTASS
ncbi:MAG: hypothetical protein ABS910_09785 [Arthrobacter sp.]